MTTCTSPDALTVHVKDRSRMDSALDSSVEALKDKARQSRQGILVTRRAPTTFTITLSADVPYGYTREAQAW